MKILSIIDKFKNGLIYTIVAIFQKLSSFLLVPVYTALLLPEKLGVFSQIQAIGALFIVLITFGLDETAALFFFRKKNNKNELRETFSTLLWISISISTCGFIILLLINEDIYSSLINDFYIVLISILWIIFYPFFSIYQKILRINLEVIRHSLFIASYSIFQMILIIVTVVYLKYNLKGLIFSFGITSVLFGLYSIYQMKSYITLQFHFEKAKKILSYSKYIFLNAILAWGLSSLIIVCLGKYGSNEDVGIYTAISFFSLILIEVSKIFINVYQPFIFKQIKNDKLVNDYTTLSTLAVFMLSLFLLLFSQLLFSFLISPQYSRGVSLIPSIISIGFCLFASSMLDQIFASRETSVSKSSIATLIVFLINCSLIYYFRNGFNLTIAVYILQADYFLLIYLKTLFIKNYSEGKLNLLPTIVIISTTYLFIQIISFQTLAFEIRTLIILVIFFATLFTQKGRIKALIN